MGWKQNNPGRRYCPAIQEVISYRINFLYGELLPFLNFRCSLYMLFVGFVLWVSLLFIFFHLGSYWIVGLFGKTYPPKQERTSVVPGVGSRSLKQLSVREICLMSKVLKRKSQKLSSRDKQGIRTKHYNSIKSPPAESGQKVVQGPEIQWIYDRKCRPVIRVIIMMMIMDSISSTYCLPTSS